MLPLLLLALALLLLSLTLLFLPLLFLALALLFLPLLLLALTLLFLPLLFLALSLLLLALALLLLPLLLLALTLLLLPLLFLALSLLFLALAFLLLPLLLLTLTLLLLPLLLLTLALFFLATAFFFLGRGYRHDQRLTVVDLWFVKVYGIGWVTLADRRRGVRKDSLGEGECRRERHARADAEDDRAPGELLRCIQLHSVIPPGSDRSCAAAGVLHGVRARRSGLATLIGR